MFEPEIDTQERTLHAHISTQQRDCDGVLVTSHVMTPNEDERVSEFSDIEFHQRVLANVVSTYTIGEAGGTLQVSKDTDGGVRLSWAETTDEGYRAIEAVICNDGDCDTNESSQRDLSAERAGY
jgi:hypothetical protein